MLGSPLVRHRAGAAAVAHDAYDAFGPFLETFLRISLFGESFQNGVESVISVMRTPAARQKRGSGPYQVAEIGVFGPKTATSKRPE
jgi:hypothetical protein